MSVSLRTIIGATAALRHILYPVKAMSNGELMVEIRHFYSWPTSMHALSLLLQCAELCIGFDNKFVTNIHL